MADVALVVISVRGEAEQIVAPDVAVLHCQIRAVAGTKQDALRAAAAAQHALERDLADLGAVRLTADAGKPPLAWLTRSTGSEPEYGERGPTGLIAGVVTVVIHVRDFARLDELEPLLARHEDLHAHGASWYVDADNPAWPQVRAAAIHAALGRGRDYAAALGGTLLRVEHVADAGLLGDTNAQSLGAVQLSAMAAAAGGEPETPSLDPVPQTLHAVIDARLVASVPPLG